MLSSTLIKQTVLRKPIFVQPALIGRVSVLKQQTRAFRGDGAPPPPPASPTPKVDHVDTLKAKGEQLGRKAAKSNTSTYALVAGVAALAYYFWPANDDPKMMKEEAKLRANALKDRAGDKVEEAKDKVEQIKADVKKAVH